MQMSTWIPDSGINDYFGNPIPSDWDFFVAPPAEIGQVRAAQSSLVTGVEPGAVTRRRVGFTALGVGVVAAFWLLLSFADWKPDELPSFYISGLIAASVIGSITWLCTKPSYLCTYVGSRGIARFACYGRRDRLVRSEVLLFADAAELRTRQRHIYVNGVYVHTDYAFAWTGPDRKVRYKLAGQHHSNYSRPKNRHEAYVFARVAECSWTDYLLERDVPRLEQGSIIEFHTKGSQCIGVGPFFLEIGGQRFGREDIEISIIRGLIYFKRPRSVSGLFGRRTIRTVAYADLANAQEFLITLQESLGIALGPIPSVKETRYHFMPGVGH